MVFQKQIRITGKRISLRSMIPEDRELFYQWATQSEATPYWFGEMSNEPVPDREAFFKDFVDYYFTGEYPLKGRSFTICLNESGEEIGQINYQEDEYLNMKGAYDMDILIASSHHQNQGYGSEAIRILVAYLNENLGIRKFSIYADKENERAIRSYQKAGFSPGEEFSDERNVKTVRLVLDL